VWGCWGQYVGASGWHDGGARAARSVLGVVVGQPGLRRCRRRADARRGAAAAAAAAAAA